METNKKNWDIAILKDIILTASGGTPSRKKIQYFQGNIPWVKSGELTDSYIYETEEHISESAVHSSSAKIFPKGSLLIALYGATIGKMAFLGVPAATNQAVCCLFNSPSINSYFLFYYLLLKRSFLINQGKGGAQKNISQETLKLLQIPVPPMAEQKRIVKKIEELFGVIDRDIQRLTDTLEQLSQFRQSVLEKLLNSHIPNSTLGELLQPRRERIIPSLKNQEMPYVGLDSIEPGALTLSKIETLQQTKSSCFLFCKDDVLYGRMRSYLNKVFKADFKGAASAEFIVFPKSEKILPDYLKYLLHQHRFVVFATKNSSGDRPRVKFEEDLAPFHFYLPTLPEQQKIVDEIEKAFRSTDKVQKAVQNALEEAKKLKQSILKKAFAGELIPQDPNDKPVNLPVLKGQTK